MDTWYTELEALLNNLVAAGMDAQVGQFLTGCLTVAACGITLPGVEEIVRETLEGLESIPALKDAMQPILASFETDVVGRQLIRAAIKQGRSGRQ